GLSSVAGVIFPGIGVVGVGISLGGMGVRFRIEDGGTGIYREGDQIAHNVHALQISCTIIPSMYAYFMLYNLNLIEISYLFVIEAILYNCYCIFMHKYFYILLRIKTLFEISRRRGIQDIRLHKLTTSKNRFTDTAFTLNIDRQIQEQPHDTHFHQIGGWYYLCFFVGHSAKQLFSM
ncbi:hypothetical protein ACJX0J_032681, partial [Zea mays]